MHADVKCTQSLAVLLPCITAAVPDLLQFTNTCRLHCSARNLLYGNFSDACVHRPMDMLKWPSQLMPISATSCQSSSSGKFLSAHQLQSNVKRLTWKAGKSLSGKSALSFYIPERDPALSYKSSGCSQEDRAVAMDIETFRLDWHDCSHPTSTPLALD